MSGPKVETLIKATTFLGEAPHWNSENQTLYFADCLPKEYIHSYNPATKDHHVVQIEGGPLDYVTLVVPQKGNTNNFIITRTRDICSLEWNGVDEKPTAINRLETVHDDLPNNRTNDGKCDALGRLWFGTMGKALPNNEFEMKRGSIFSFDKDFTLKKHVDGINLSNGLAWNPENTIMYYIDSFNYAVDAFDFDLQEGTLSNRRTIYDLKANNTVGIPDGMTIDVDGKIWFAGWGSSKIYHLDPAVGKIVSHIEFPATNITSAMFGGPNLDILYVTSAQKDLPNPSEQPFAGSLFEVTNLGTKGIAAVNFAGAL